MVIRMHRKPYVLRMPVDWDSPFGNLSGRFSQIKDVPPWLSVSSSRYNFLPRLFQRNAQITMQRKLRFNFLFYYLCIYLWVCACQCCACGGQKKVLGSLNLKFQAVVSLQSGGDQTRILCRSSRCSSPLSHLFNP